MTLNSETSLDRTDWQILRELQQDARLSFNELGRRVNLSAPATAERVRKLEDRGVITGRRACKHSCVWRPETRRQGSNYWLLSSS
jgi:Lrp/AsnC family leucine-responsive transcriptional regulator